MSITPTGSRCIVRRDDADLVMTINLDRCTAGERGVLSLSLLCLAVLTRDRDDFENLEEMLPTTQMQELYAIALGSASWRSGP
jgi:hypothetical protein